MFHEKSLGPDGSKTHGSNPWEQGGKEDREKRLPRLRAVLGRLGRRVSGIRGSNEALSAQSNDVSATVPSTENNLGHPVFQPSWEGPAVQAEQPQQLTDVAATPASVTSNPFEADRSRPLNSAELRVQQTLRISPEDTRYVTQLLKGGDAHLSPAPEYSSDVTVSGKDFATLPFQNPDALTTQELRDKAAKIRHYAGLLRRAGGGPNQEQSVRFSDPNSTINLVAVREPRDDSEVSIAEAYQATVYALGGEFVDPKDIDPAIVISSPNRDQHDGTAEITKMVGTSPQGDKFLIVACVYRDPTTDQIVDYKVRREPFNMVGEAAA
jgi:hypothetical protein